MTGLPGRGLEYIKALPADADGRPRVETLCDCGTTTVLTLAIDGPVPPGSSAEAAWTCDGCQTSHWFKLTSDAEPGPALTDGPGEWAGA